VQVSEFCSREVATVEPLASLRVASLLMRNRHVGTLVVVDGGRGAARESTERRPLDVA
jgi:CBS domain-containing protein